MVRDLTSRVRRLYKLMGENIDSEHWACSHERFGVKMEVYDTRVKVYKSVRSSIRDYFPELKLKRRLDEKDEDS